ncbi:MAG: threonine-phosphate decarboxylase [Nitrospira sp.]|nr:threonine-phosphate decarboxylase [Nitrospira sp.]
MARLTIRRHGGDIYAAARELGRAPDEILDFSASINPLGPSPRVWKTLTASRYLLSHYPDSDCWDLRQALATFWRIDPEQMVVGNGSTELIESLPRALEIQRLLVVQPTFSEYAAAMVRAGGQTTALCADRNDHYAIPIDRLCQVMETGRHDGRSIDGVVLCHPNSPTGQACSADDVAWLAKATRRRGIWLVIDEAFADYCPERSVLPYAASWPHVVVLRSMTKFYALPGLRVGYAVATPATIRRVRRQLPPWSVSMMAQVAALAAVNDAAHARKSLRFMAREHERLRQSLTALPGCVVMPTYANYFFVELPRGRHARNITEQLRSRGLLIRDCSPVPGANSRSIRLAVRTVPDNDRLIQALAQLLQQGVSS